MLWDWTCHHNYAKHGSSEKPYQKLKPTQKRDAFQLGKILCRGIVANQVADDKPDVNAYQYKFMLAANLVRVGARSQDFKEVKALYDELKPLMTGSQGFSLLMFFVALCFEAKGKVRENALSIFMEESMQFSIEDVPEGYHCYSLWRGLLGDEPGPPLTLEQSRRLAEKVKSLEGTKVALTYERNRKSWGKLR